MVSLKDLLEVMIKKDASDLHLTVGSSPVMRIDGRLVRTEFDVLTPEDTRKLAYSVRNQKHVQKCEENSELDLSFGIENLSRLRPNVFMQRGCVAVALRQIPHKIRADAA